MSNALSSNNKDPNVPISNELTDLFSCCSYSYSGIIIRLIKFLVRLLKLFYFFLFNIITHKIIYIYFCTKVVNKRYLCVNIKYVNVKYFSLKCSLNEYIT